MAEEIAEGTQQTMSPTSQTQSQLFKYFLFALAGFLLLTAGAVGGYWITSEKLKVKSEKPQPKTQIPETPTPEPTPTPSPAVEDRTEGWKTYRNEEYGFEIKYPPISDWEISKETGRPLVVQFGPEWCITVFEYAKNLRSLNVKKFCEEQYKNITLEEAPFVDDPCWHVLYKEPEPLDMGDKEILQVKRVGGPLATTATLISIDNFILAISKIESDYAGYEGKCGLLNADKVYNQILSTFKFLD